MVFLFFAAQENTTRYFDKKREKNRQTKEGVFLVTKPFCFSASGKGFFFFLLFFLPKGILLLCFFLLLFCYLQAANVI
jgi:hypothetical protein